MEMCKHNNCIHVINKLWPSNIIIEICRKKYSLQLLYLFILYFCIYCIFLLSEKAVLSCSYK